MRTVQLTLVCFALKEEAGPFRRVMAKQPGVSVLLTGIGGQNAERRVRESLAEKSPSLVYTCGFAGALNPELTLGAVIYSTDDVTQAGKLTAAGARPATFFCAQRIATTAAEKQELRRTTGADAVEMESGEIQTVCRERGVPCTTVRVISDAANEDLPLDFNELSKPDQSLDSSKLAGAVARNPSKIKALLRLQKNCRFAATRLADVLAKVVLP